MNSARSNTGCPRTGQTADSVGRTSGRGMLGAGCPALETSDLRTSHVRTRGTTEGEAPKESRSCAEFENGTEDGEDAA